MATIRVEKLGAGGEYQVTVEEGKSQSRHRVSLTPSVHQRLTAGRVRPEDLLVAAFRFLLDRESKESILPRFDFQIISRYFPDFEEKLAGYLPD